LQQAVARAAVSGDEAGQAGALRGAGALAGGEKRKAGTFPAGTPLLVGEAHAPLGLAMCHPLFLPARAGPHGPPPPAPGPRDAPDFFAVEIGFRSAGASLIDIDGVAVEVTCQVLDDLVWVADCRYRLADALADDAVARKAAIEQELHRRLLELAEAADGEL